MDSTEGLVRGKTADTGGRSIPSDRRPRRIMNVIGERGRADDRKRGALFDSPEAPPSSIKATECSVRDGHKVVTC